ncbi:hypothetical protein R50073_12960 [Maricurvus nonylphenolicus]|uniref:hypothetical protein n=1 Tax=Maricurvus nonylphenolicus TaxID=1008307 RepID=UPI0036F2D2BF
MNLKILLQIVILFLISDCFATEGERSIRVGIPLGNPPWLYKDKDTGKVVGREFETQKIIHGMIGLTPEIVPFENIVRVAAEMIKGTIDAGPLIQSDRIEVMPMPESLSCTQYPYGGSDAYLYTLDDSDIPFTEDIHDLSHLNMAFSRLVDIHEYFPTFSRKQITTHKNPDEALKMLVAGRSQLILSTPDTTEHWRNERGIKLKPVYPFHSFQVHMCFSNSSLGEKKAQRYAQQLDQQLSKFPVPINKMPTIK